MYDLSQPWDDRLMLVEQALHRACREEVREQRLLVSTRLDELLSVVDAAWPAAHGSPG